MPSLIAGLCLSVIAVVAEAPMSWATLPPHQEPTYLVLFEFGESAIGPGGRETLKQAASWNKGIGLRQYVRVSAHTDTAEASDELSLARGMAVRDFLIEGGVPAARIVIQSCADRQLPTPTPPNTREPLNRRVEIQQYTDWEVAHPPPRINRDR